MNNRMWNSKNPYQGKSEMVLCLCSAGLLRSPTTAVIMAQRGYNTRAAGLETNFALIPVDDVLYSWADMVVVMDSSQAEEVDKHFDGPIYNFNLPDQFEYMHPDLVELINNRIENLEFHRWDV